MGNTPAIWVRGASPLSIAVKYSAGYGIAIALLAIVALAAHRGEVKYRAAESAGAHASAVIDELEGLWAEIVEAESALRGYVITGKPTILDQFEGQPEQIATRLNSLQDLVAGTPDLEDRFIALSDAVAERLDVARTAAGKRRTGGFEPAASVVSAGTGGALTGKIRQAIDGMVAAEQDNAAKAQAGAAASLRLIRLISVSGVLGVSVLILSAWYWSTRRMTERVRELVTAARIMGSGDLSHRLEPRGSDEFSQIARAINAMAERLQQSREALAAFAYTVSHDLRAPLRAMQGFSQALIEDCGDQLNDEGHDFVRRIDAAAVKMDEMLNDILTYARVERQDMDIKMVPLEPVVDEVLSSLSPSIADAHATVSVERPLPSVLGCRPVLEQALTNLVTNALKFRKKGNAPEVRISAQKTNGTVRLSVADNGIGIDPDHHGRIFNVFERLHGIDAYPGTGIGLAIVRKGIERMGGRTGVESAPGHGSRFWIELPPGEAA